MIYEKNKEICLLLFLFKITTGECTSVKMMFQFSGSKNVVLRQVPSIFH